MKFTTSAVVASTLAFVSASPIDGFIKPSGYDVFSLISIAPNTPVQNGIVQAVKGGLSINAPKQNSSCAGAERNYASFQINEEGELFLYTPNPPQQAYVDRSGMGQGLVLVRTGVQGPGRNEESGPFKITDDSNLIFAATNGESEFQACPGTKEDGYKIWLRGVVTPAGIQGCFPITLKATKESNPVKCSYLGMEN